MKKSINYLMMFMSFGALTLFMACGDDEPSIIDDDPIPVADGMYVLGSATSTEAGIAFQMGDGVVGGPDFTYLARTGMYSGFIYLGSGDFNFVQYSNNEAISYGGSVTNSALGADTDVQMATGTLKEDGAAISPVEANTLHHLVVDLTSSTIFLTPVKYWEIIGPAQELGWAAGTKIDATGSSAEESTFQGTDIVLRGPAQYKYRYNSTWDVAFDDIEEFNIFTNFGIDAGALVTGGPNFNFEDEDGTYTISVSFAAGSPPTFTQERTGDAPEITFAPEDYAWGIIGDATAGGWDSDRDLFYKGLDDTKGHWWAGLIYLADAGNMKFRANDAWDINLGGTVTLDGDAAVLEAGGADIGTPGAGAYYVELYTTDEGTTWNGSIATSAGWGVIGDGSPQGNWDADIDMTANGFSEGVTSYSITDDFTASEWKFRANDDWVINIGGELTNLVQDGGNLTTDAGTKTVTLYVGLADDGKTKYWATVE